MTWNPYRTNWWLPGNPAGRYFDSMDIREYEYYRSRYGVAGSTDYQLGQGSNIYLRGLFSDFHNFGDRWVYTLTTTVALNLLNGAGGPPSFNNSIRRPRYIISNLVLGGKHVLASTWFSWDVSGSFASENDNGYGGGSFGVPNPSTYATARAPMILQRPGIPLRRDGRSVLHGGLQHLHLRPERREHQPWKDGAIEFAVAGAMGKRYHLGSHLSTIEIGGKFRNANKYDHSYADDYAVPTIGGSGSNANDYAEVIPFSLFPNYVSQLRLLQRNVPARTICGLLQDPSVCLCASEPIRFHDRRSGTANFYSYIEQVSAGYVMNTIDFGKFRFIAGVRVEGTNLNTLTWQNGCTDPTVCPTIVQPGQNLKAGGDYINVLPSAFAALCVDQQYRLSPCL